MTLLGDFDRLRLAPARLQHLRHALAPSSTRWHLEARCGTVGTSTCRHAAPSRTRMRTASARPAHRCTPVAAGGRTRAIHTRPMRTRRGGCTVGIRLADSRPHATHSCTPHCVDDSIDLLDTLRRWGVKTLGALAALAAGRRLRAAGRARGALAAARARRGSRPLVPWVPEDPFEAIARSRVADRRARAACRSCSPDCSSRWPSGSSAPIAARPILHTHLRLVVERRCMPGRCSCRRRCAIRKRCARWCCSISNPIPPSAAIDRVRVLDRADARRA